MKLNNIFTALAGVALLWGASACTDEVKYDPTPKYDGDQVFFSPNDPSAIQIAYGASEFSFPLHRYSADGELTVGLECTITAPEGVEMNQVFTLPTQVTFPADVKDIQVPVGVAFTALTPEVDYTLSVKIAEKASPYGPTASVFVASYAPWEDWTEYSKEFGEGVMGSPWTGEVVGGVVMKRKSLINDNQMSYLFPGPRFSNLYFDYELNIDKTVTWIDEEGTTCYRVSMPLTDTHFDNGDQRIMYMDAFNWMRQYGAENGMNLSSEKIDQIMAANGFGQSYFNPETGTFYLWLVPCVRGEELRRYGQSYTVLQLPGFSHYDITFNELGSFVNSSGTESYIIEAVKSSDVYSFAYTIESGSLSEAQVEAVAEAIKADGDAQLYYDESVLIQYEPAEEGDYTIVAVGYDEAGLPVGTFSYGFTFESVMKPSTFKEIGICDYTDAYLPYAIKSFPVETWDVKVEESTETPGLYRLVDPYYAIAQMYGGAGFTYVKGKHYVVINAEDPEGVYIDLQTTGLDMDNDGDQLVVGSMAANAMAGGATLAQVKQAGMCGTLKDGVITFPNEMLIGSWLSLISQGKAFIANQAGEFCLDLGSAAAAKSQTKAFTTKVDLNRVERVKNESFINIAKMDANRGTVSREQLRDMLLSKPEFVKF